MGSSCCTTAQQYSKDEILIQNLSKEKSEIQNKQSSRQSNLEVKMDEVSVLKSDKPPYSDCQIDKEDLKQESKPAIKFEMYVTSREPEEKKVDAKAEKADPDDEDENQPILVQRLKTVEPPTVDESAKEPQVASDQASQSRPLNTEGCNQYIYTQVQRDMMSPVPEGLGTRSVKSMKIGADLFVNLKKGSITKYYTTGQILGQGAFGKVCKVTHKTTGIIRAMKQIKKTALIKEEEMKLFSEMNILKNLDHPHIVKLYELYQDQYNYYLITEYLSGGELFDRIKKMTYFSERRAADFLRQILLAVVYCHEQKIVHRDLKPENIIFVSNENDSNLKVIDFGTSRKFTGKTMTKKLGTPYYIAPEVLNQNYNEKCDVWSCGVILYILLCGYPPFTGKNERDILNKVKLGKFSFDSEDWALISKEAKLLINKMLNIDPNNRISAKQALNDPWIQKHAPSQPFNKKVLTNLSHFQAQSVFKQALMSYIVTQMTTQQETDELAKTFHSLDTNSDGFLSREELLSGYLQVMRDKVKAEEEVERILNLLDTNQSGKIDYSEFLVAAMNQEKITNMKKVEQAFKIFDQDGDGFISRNEIEQVMGEVEIETWQQFLDECDINGDGKISHEEFKKILMSKT